MLTPMLEGKHILLGITGSIAAYKAAVLCRLFRTHKAEVKVIMTQSAKAFISPLTMATLSKNPIAVEFYNPENGDWHSHISMGEWADLMVIAPATANTLAKMANGIADNLLLTTYLSARCTTVVAPAMDCAMFANDATQNNLKILASRGVVILDSPAGELASGLEGKGRMAEPEQIVEAVDSLLAEKKKTLKGLRFIVTAGATIEAIDPVRYITNHSTGKMGYSLARALSARGADVTLISGPTSLECPCGVKILNVTSAQEMYEACMSLFNDSDGAVMCAAVADYTPIDTSTEKIKKHSETISIQLRKTHDIAAELGSIKKSRILVGFAMETENLERNAEEKLKRKNLDFIVLNSLRTPGAGFGTDTNVVTIIDSKGKTELPLMSKNKVSEHIVDRIEEIVTERQKC